MLRLLLKKVRKLNVFDTESRFISIIACISLNSKGFWIMGAIAQGPYDGCSHKIDIRLVLSHEEPRTTTFYLYADDLFPRLFIATTSSFLRLTTTYSPSRTLTLPNDHSFITKATPSIVRTPLSNSNAKYLHQDKSKMKHDPGRHYL